MIDHPITEPNMTSSRIPVLIIGAGLAGLTAALLLARRGVPALLVERRVSTSRHPRARGVNLRSLELLRTVDGLETELRQAARAGAGEFSIIVAESVTGREIETLLSPGMFDTSWLSPSANCHAGQDRVEPILLRHARRLGADIRFGTELVSFTQGGDSVRALLRDRASGAEYGVEAQYMVAADGNRSPVRKALGIATEGKGTLSHNLSILFRAELDTVLKGSGFYLYYLQNPAFTGAFVSTDDADIGQVSLEYDPLTEDAATYDATRCAGLVRAALGTPDLAVDVLDVMPWEMSAQLATRMAEGRIFLAGDAAHTMPPTGGLGGQTAMQDAADLAWKLALVLQGQAGPALLGTYEAERRPVAALTVARQTANYVERMRPDRSELTEPDTEADYLSVAMGYRYRSAAILSAADDNGKATETPLNPTGQPGTRLAHIPLQRGGEAVSTIDLVGGRFLLLAGAEAEAWAAAAERVARKLGLDLAVERVGSALADPAGGLAARAGLTAQGALLVRPDGYVAWRSLVAEADPARILETALTGILCRGMTAASWAA